MTYTAATQVAQALPAKVFMESLDTLLLAAGFEFVEQWPGVHIRAAAQSNVTAGNMTGFAYVADGVTLVEGDRVLLQIQTTPSQNGIWVAHTGAWTRADDFDADGDLYVDLFVVADEGVIANAAYSVSATSATPWVPGSSTSTWLGRGVFAKYRIYKSPAASNSQGADWYFIVGRSLDTSASVTFLTAELYDPVKKFFRNYAPTAGSAPLPVTFAVNDAVGKTANSSSLAGQQITLSAAGFQYWVSANPNRITITTRIGTTNYGVYIGLYDDILPASISPFPLCVVNLSSIAAGSALGKATREPNTTTSISNNFAVNAFDTVGLTTEVVDIYLGSRVPGRAALYSGRINASRNTSANGIRGFLKDILFHIIVGAVAGDTITVTNAVGATKTYTAIGAPPNGVYWVDQGV